MNKIEFVRWGGLSSVNHKKAYKEDTFHSPPCKRGIYVFHKEWVEPFLYLWKEKIDEEGNRIRIHPRRFNYNGKIWTHMHYIHPKIIYYRHYKSWYETDTSCIDKIIKLEVKEMNKQINNDSTTWMNKCYKLTTKDHMEFFIEKL